MMRALLVALTVLMRLVGCGGGTEVDHDPYKLNPSKAPAADATHAAAGESHSDSPKAASPTSTAAAKPVSAEAPEKADAKSRPTKPLAQIRFKDGSGARVYELKPKNDGAKLVDPKEKELARYNVSERKVKVKRPDDSVVGYIIAKEAEFKLTDPTQKKELFELQRQPDGDWKLKSSSDELLAIIKVRDYGFEIEDGHEKSILKIKRRDEKTELRDSSDKTVLSTSDPLSQLGAACMGLSGIPELELRAGLVVAVELFPQSGASQ